MKIQYCQLITLSTWNLTCCSIRNAYAINSYSDKEEDRSLEVDDQTFVLNLEKYTKDHQMDQPVQQHGNVEASQTNMNNQQVAVRSGTCSVSVLVNIFNLSTR